MILMIGVKHLETEVPKQFSRNNYKLSALTQLEKWCSTPSPPRKDTDI